MSKTATMTLKSGAKVVVNVNTVKTATKVQATISYRNTTVYASGPNEPAAIKAAHEKFLNVY